MKIILIGILFISILLLVGCDAIVQDNEGIVLESFSIYENNLNIENPSTFLMFITDIRKEATYTIKSRIFEQNNIRITFPEVEIDSDEMQTKINSLIWEDVQILINWLPDDWDYDIALDVDYRIALSTDRMLSIVYTGLYFAQGTPGPSSIFFTTNVNILTGERVVLNSVICIDESFITLLKSDNANFLIPEQRDFVISQFISNDKFQNRLQSADNKEISEIFSYFTHDSLGISIGGIGRGGGSHAEIEISYEVLLYRKY